MWHRWVWALGLWLLVGVSHAQVAWDSHSGYAYSNSPGKVTVTPTAKPSDFERLLMGRSYTPGAAADKAVMRDLLNKPSNLFGGANPLPAALERQVAGKAVARGVARLVPVVGTALLISDVIDLVESTGCKLNLDVAKIECEGDYVDGPPRHDYIYRLQSTGVYYDSEGEAVDAEVRRLNAVINSGWNVGGVVANCVGGEYSGAWRPWSCQQTKRWAKDYPGGPAYSMPDSTVLFQIGKFEAGGGTVKRCEFELNEKGECVLNPDPDDFADRVPSDNADNATKRPNVMDWVDKNGGFYETENPKVVDLPPSISGGRYETTNNPDGSVTTKDRDYILRTSSTPSPAPSIIVDIRDTVTTWPSGTTPTPAAEPGIPSAPPVAAPVGGSQSTTTTVPSAGGGGGATTVEVKSCGLPDTPPCKIDESGTPEWEGKDGSSDAGGVFAALGACLADVSSCVPALPDLSWSFSLPNTCAPIPVPAFAPYLTEIDICPYQPVIHDLMSMVWAAAGLFAGISMIGRDARASI